MAFAVRVEGLSAGADIPRRYTCDGEDIPPRIQWTDKPASTKSFAVIVDDPDAPDGTWTHWLVWDIPASVRSISAVRRPPECESFMPTVMPRYAQILRRHSEDTML